jgi:hypothetical protein
MSKKSGQTAGFLCLPSRVAKIPITRSCRLKPLQFSFRLPVEQT